MALPQEPIVKKFFTNKIESTRADWYQYLIHIARIFLSLDGEIYNRERLLEKFSAMSGRSATAQRDTSNFRDEFGAYGTYLGIYHLEPEGDTWKIVVSEAAKQLLCSENPNAAAFCRIQLSLFQYPNGAGAGVSGYGAMTVQGNIRTDTMRELSNQIRLNPFRLICRTVVALVENKNVPLHEVAIPHQVLFCMVNDDRINHTYDPPLELIANVFEEYRTAGDNIPMNIDGLTNFKRNFHIFEKTGLFVRDSRFGLLVAQANPTAAYECIKTISNISMSFTAFEEEYRTPDENRVKDIIASPAWGRYYDGANLPLEILTDLGVEIDKPPIERRPFYTESDDENGENMDVTETPNHTYTREELMAMENKEFIFTCLGIMVRNGLWNAHTVPILENREICSSKFRHNNIHGIVYRRPIAVTDEEFREGMQDDAGRARYYSDTYRIDDEEYYVSSQWRPDREEARGPFVDWIFELLREIKFETGLVSSFERNRITFGAPGTGKSHRLNEDRKRLLENTSGSYERVTFHPEYTYSQFVGSYKPVTNDDGEIRYDFVPGPFMRVLVAALKSGRTDSPQPHLLLIEEINRAKVAAVFGDVFQLLDRADSGASEYEIHATEDIKKYLISQLGKATDIIRIPDNMFIWATMNSADQGVFPMDTAFKRRWNFEYIGIDENDAEVGGIVTLGHGDHAMDIEWNQLRRAINDTLAVDYNVNEDKLLGPYFLGQRVFAYGEDRRMLNPAKFIDAFKSKVIMYLYEDAAKPVRKRLFEGCDSSRYSSVCEAFDERGIEIFGTAFLEKYRSFEE